MKRYISAFILCFFATTLFAQNVRINDSVIFINNKPVALYAKELSNSPQKYNMEVYSFTDYILIKAEIIKFNAPVRELKPFYYYELTFPPTSDTFAIYIEEEAFPLVLAKIIADYNLISKNELNKKQVARFIATYYGGQVLSDKIKSFQNHLNDTRYFNEQVIRDRTKPVTIINERVIMQDGVKIGLIVVNQNYQTTNQPTEIVYGRSNYGIPFTVISDRAIYSSSETDFLFPNGRKVDMSRHYRTWSREIPKNEAEKPSLAEERNLYQLSKAENKKISGFTDQLLMRVCAMIEDYAL